MNKIKIDQYAVRERGRTYEILKIPFINICGHLMITRKKIC